jgi:hypothetical protein
MIPEAPNDCSMTRKEGLLRFCRDKTPLFGQNMYYMKNEFINSVWKLALLLGVMALGCASDPWPEPDEAKKSGGGAPAPSDDGDLSDSDEEAGGDFVSGDADGDGDGDADGDTEAADEDDDDNGITADDTDEPDGPASVGTDLEEEADTSTEHVAPEDTEGTWDGDVQGDTAAEDNQGGDSDRSDDEAVADDTGSSWTDTEWEVDGSADAGAPGGADASDWQADTPILGEVYVSAPGPSGLVTLVGLAGSVLMNGEVAVIYDGGNIPVTVGADGGFVTRFAAGPGEPVQVAVRFNAPEDDIAVTLLTGSLDNGSVDQGITGSAGAVTHLSEEAQVIIHGRGARLASDQLVIGGNLGLSTGRSAPVSCGADGCSFDLLLPGQSGSEIDLFLVPAGEQTGITDVQTVVVPPTQP